MSVSRRATAMAARVQETAERVGVNSRGRELMAEAFALAIRHRSHLHDHHHPDFLHTARTALVLMDDAGEADPRILAAALVLETRDPALVLPEDGLRALGLANLVEGIPTPGRTPELLEALLALPRDQARLAVAERLDHARHLHLRDRAEWAGEHALCCQAYAPLAGRLDPVLERRFAWWCRTFARRLSG
ncbi:MAG TPA: hypothetical protein VK966_12220 [Longimicrobiales bacterium]|nr:hypothetical protein [Longimicrobiales bacterium]